ncbi:MAG TPA: YihY/virulence factor BrkB family protein [Candidatus Dormibacteraeota bacterium]|nr:YihY/virulence factor BrkB family protein [Candidatus Dormibacteraeota bacterium]
MRLFRALRLAARAFSATGSGVLAQAIAYNALFAIFPLVLLLAAILGYLGGTDAGARQTLAVLGPVTPVARRVLERDLHHVVQYRGISGAVGLLILMWSAKNVFVTMAYALDRALDTPKEGPIVRNTLVAALMIPLLGALLLASAVLPVGLTSVARLGGLADAALVDQLAAYVSSVLLFFFMAAALYRWLPNAPLNLRTVLPGAFFCAVAWTVLQVGFGIYSAHADFTRVYGAIAGIMVLLLWFYCLAAILLFGAHFFIAWSGTPREPGAGESGARVVSS